MTDHFNGLTPAQAERLAILLEELGEAQQAIGKILRHGYESRNPELSHAPTNRTDLERELGHVAHAVHRLVFGGDLSSTEIKLHGSRKAESIKQYLHHQP